MSRELEVPLLDLGAQYAAIRSELDEALARVVRSQRFVLGPEVEALEAELAAYCDVGFAVGCASGSDALLLALLALGVGAGDEVVCPSYSFFATAGSIAQLGATPVFADVDPVSYNLEPTAARKAAERCTKLKAILPVHLFGQVADMEALLGIGRDLGVAVVEDAAQAIGARDAQGVRAGTRGAAGCFSFYPTKNLGGFGDGGAVTSNDPELAERIAMLRVHGGRTRYHHELVGLNSRLDALQAAVVRAKLPHLDGWSQARSENASYYDRAFAAAGAVDTGTPLADARLPLRTPRPPAPPAQCIYNQYVIRVPQERRDALRRHLEERGVGTEVYYPLGLHEQECFAQLRSARGELGETESAARETLALPVYPELTRRQLDHVVDAVVDFLRR